MNKVRTKTLKTATVGKAACLIEEYAVNSHIFCMGLPMSNRKLYNLQFCKLKKEQVR